MANNTVTISGMFGEKDGKIHTYFIDSPVVIDISGLYWGNPVTSPFTVVRVEVIYQDVVVGKFKADTGGQTSISFDISSALRTIWSDYRYVSELLAAKGCTAVSRLYREYSLMVYTEYMASDDGGVPVQTGFGPFTGGRCAIGGLTPLERSTVGAKENADVSYLDGRNPRNGDASNKPTASLERVGRNSITSWVDVKDSGTKSAFFSADTEAVPDEQDSMEAHAPLVLRDTQDYVDFLFLNRRGAIETCSGLTKEAMNIDIDIKHYAKVERPSFIPTRSLMAIGTDNRRSWQMSSGYVTREWAEWWADEFLGGKRKQWWMRYPLGDANGTYVPVVIEPAKKSINIYDRSKQQMVHVDFTVTLALEG